MTKQLFFLAFFAILCFRSFAQSPSNFRSTHVELTAMSIKLDSLSIVPNSWNVSGVDTSEYEVNFLSSTLFLRDSLSLHKTIHCSYRVFQYDFSKVISHKSPDLIAPKQVYYTPYIIESSSSSLSALRQDASLQSSGSISRGISIGNSQNFSLHSALNLQLSGNLTEDVTILANITDKNIPIQPEGNTRYIQDFNKIFIELRYKNLFSIIAGDITINSPANCYLRVNRNALGMSFRSNVAIDSNNQIKNMVGGGVQKGKFTRNDITPIEGIQGPYQLHGQQQETNIMIISGSERVYMDGQLLIRGSDHDYTIDYNVGEITFSAKHLMNPEKRIIIVFEYSDFAYSRYLLFSYNHFQHEKINKLNIHVNFYQEHDLKNHSIQPELSIDQKKLLANIGNQLEQAQFYNAEIVPFSNQEILYKKVDTIVNGTSYSAIYVHTTNPNDTCYQLKFTFLGDKKGNYRLSSTATANGRLFEWVAPIDSTPQGNYEPLLKLTTPTLQQMATIGADMQIGNHSFIATEFAISNYDKNCFSKKDDENNVGFASKIHYTFQKKIRSKKEKDWVLRNQIDYEYIHRNFQRIESFRAVEFARMYNLSSDYATNQSEQMAQFTTSIKQDEAFSLRYNLNFFSRLPQLHALRNQIVSTVLFKKFHFSTTSSYLFSQDEIQRTNYINTENHLSQTFEHIEIGLIEKLEYNIFNNISTKELRPNSFAFNDLYFYIKNPKSSKIGFNIGYKNRIEHAVNENQQMALHHIVNEIQGSSEIIHHINQQLRATLTYRNVFYTETTNEQQENHFIGSVQYNGKFFKNALLLSTFYEVGSGLEPKRSYRFLQVTEGQGTHVWIDYNENGIEELDEFEIAVFRDQANYIKVLLTNNEFINTYNNQFTQSVHIQPYNLWYNKKGILKLLSRFSNISIFKIAQKNTLDNLWYALNPFNLNIENNFLVSQQMNFKNTFSFNKNNSYFGIDCILQRNQVKSLLYYGFEHNKLYTEEVIINGNPHQVINLRSHYIHGKKENHSEFFSSRDYEIESHLIENTILLQFFSNLLLNFSFSYQNKQKIDDIIQLHRLQVEFSTTYRMPEKGNIVGSFTYSKNSYDGDENSTLTYEMLEGLQKGNNFLWGVAYQSYIGEFLEIDLLYEGRTAVGMRTVHTGRVQMRAHF